MTLVALGELRRYAPDALRMAGIPIGQSDEVAEMFVWTEAVRGDALTFLRRSRARLRWEPGPRMRVTAEDTDRVRVDARGGSLLQFGLRIFDFVEAEVHVRGTRTVEIDNVYGEAFLDYLIARSAERGVAASATWTGPTLTLQAFSAKPRSGARRTDAFLAAVDDGLDIADEDFADFTALFEMLRVPTSERSRSHAG